MLELQRIMLKAFAPKAFITCQAVFLVSISLLFTAGFLAANEFQLPDLEDETRKKAAINWEKPIVSRGFGYEAGDEQDQRFEVSYKKGQIAYFFGEYDKAFSLWQPLAASGHTESQASLAWLYHAGLGVEKNIAAAYDLYVKAANKANAVAQNNLGVLFEKGQHVSKDLVKARHWYQQAAENGYRFAQHNYANFLAEGQGGDKNLQDALLWYQKASDQNVKQAKEKLESLQAVK